MQLSYHVTPCLLQHWYFKMRFLSWSTWNKMCISENVSTKMIQISKIKWRYSEREKTIFETGRYFWRSVATTSFSKEVGSFLPSMANLNYKNFFWERGDILNHAPLMINCGCLSMHQNVSKALTVIRHCSRCCTQISQSKKGLFLLLFVGRHIFWMN